MADRRVILSPELWEHLKNKKKRNIIVEVATSDTSDFDVSELFIRTCDNAHREYLVSKKKYRELPIEGIEPSEAVVLLPNYRMEISDEISFDLKKIWFVNKITFEGINL